VTRVSAGDQGLGERKSGGCTIRLLSDAEYLGLFGVARPGRAEYAPLAGSMRLHEYVTDGRWTGRAAVLWDAGAPAEIVFWGYSGD
jgi:hypothetical protein